MSTFSTKLRLYFCAARACASAARSASVSARKPSTRTSRASVGGDVAGALAGLARGVDRRRRRSSAPSLSAVATRSRHSSSWFASSSRRASSRQRLRSRVAARHRAVTNASASAVAHVAASTLASASAARETASSRVDAVVVANVAVGANARESSGAPRVVAVARVARRAREGETRASARAVARAVAIARGVALCGRRRMDGWMDGRMDGFGTTRRRAATTARRDATRRRAMSADAAREPWARSYAEATVKHAKPRREDDGDRSAPTRFAYGTAGFRTTATALRSTCFRAGAFAAARAMAHGGKTTGMVVTASHNPASDNGVKLVEPSGGTLPMALESVAEMLANAEDGDAETQVRALREAMATAAPADAASANASARVFVARDTRESGRALADATLAGVRAMGVEAVDRGIATTPQLHYYVYCANVGADDSERAYYDRLSAGYAALTERDEDEDEDDDHGATVVIDCADGVGGVKLSSLGEAVAPYGLAFDLRNRGDEPTSSLNDGVGSDFVQKGKTIPTRGGFENLPAGTRCVSIDGDADRLVYFQTTAAGGVDLVDGDQLAVLIACWMNARVKEAAPYLNDITVGVVQTAYANGASTEFLTRELGAAPACVPTGVKHLHHRAEEFDIGVYFESNGHGTALFSPSASKAIEDATVEALVARDMPAVKALLALTNAQRVINPSVGDAMSGILLVEAILRRTVKAPRLGSFYKDLPSRQTKVVVADRTKIRTFDAERRVAEPEGLQDAIDAIVRASNDARCRAFVRPSGTEDCVRVYVEASEETRVEETTRAIVRAVEAHCG